MPPNDPLIELDRATVVRGETTVIDALDLRIDLGQHTAILGPNGCGKSTFIKLINRELYPLAREGQTPVKVFGQSRWNVAQLRTRLGVVTGDLTRDLQSMYQLSVLDAVVTGFFSSFVPPLDQAVTPAMRADAHEALARVGVAELAARPVDTLSTGQMRRVLIARALVHRPEAMLLDEPTTGLDVVAQHRFRDLIADLAAQGVTLVLVTHHLEEIVPAIGRVVVLREGRVLADGPSAEILTDAHLSDLYGLPMRVGRAGGVYRAHPMP
ncbi:MAG: ATP-binding cassette domain-containing protein [Pseudoxanthomonas sp.]